MSGLIGASGSPRSLPRAVDALAASARQAGEPGLMWVAGFVYQAMSLGWTALVGAVWPILERSLPELVPATSWVRSLAPVPSTYAGALLGHPIAFLLAFPLLLPLFRVAAGLAALAPPAEWERARGARRAPRLRQAWRRGAGLSLPVVGLWLQLLVMMAVAALLFVAPAQLVLRVLELREGSALRALLTAGTFALISFYSFLLTILLQLALHSLVQNRRGVGSALLHSWRIARNDPLATVRMTVVDASLYATVLAGQVLFALSIAFGGWWLWVPALLGMLALEGFAGATRCAFWARAYRVLGGVSTLGPEAPELLAAPGEQPAASGGRS